MGNISVLEEDNLEVKKLDAIEQVEDHSLLNLLNEGEAKFYGYFDEHYQELQNEHGREGRLKGSIVIRHEDYPSYVKCVWDEKGFDIKEGKVVFED